MAADIAESLDVGDKVKHPKFGQGTITLRIGEGENQKVVVKFGAEVGEKKLVVKFANLKKLQERPTLPAAPAAEAATQPAGAVKRATLDNDTDAELEDDALDVDADDDDDDADAEDDAEEEEEEK